MSNSFSEDPKRNPQLDPSRKGKRAALDFDPLTQKLTGLTGTLVFCDLTFEACRQDLELIIPMSRKIAGANSVHRIPNNNEESRPDQIKEPIT
jgi:hypothetical protein